MSTISKLPFPLSPQISGLPAGADLLRSVLDPFLQQQLEELNRFYALRSFRLGLRTGLALARAEVWVFETEARAEISGFIGLLGDYIAGIFVRREARSGGVGRQLLDHVKTSRGQLRLQVYRKNLRAAAFYRREGFRVLEEGVDPETGEAELLMEWRWDSPQS